MNWRNCKVCRKVILDGMNDVCKECREEEEQDLIKVMDYLRANPGTTIAQISEDTGVPEKRINKFIKKGRLVTTDFKIPCSVCGNEFKADYSMVCNECRKRMDNELTKARATERKGSGEPRPKKPGSSDIDEKNFGSSKRKLR